MMSTSGADRPLVISLSAPLRITSARDSEPVCSIAAKALRDRQHRHQHDHHAGDADDGDAGGAERCGMVRRFSMRDGERLLMKFTVSPL
jgi:hypothetical protein